MWRGEPCVLNLFYYIDFFLFCDANNFETSQMR